MPASGGQESGKNPMDRGKPGTKRHLLDDKNGNLLVALLSGAKTLNCTMLEKVVDAVLPIVIDRRNRAN